MAYASTSEVTLADEKELEAIASIRGKLEPELKKVKDAGNDFPHTTGDIFFTRLLRGNNGNIDEAVEWYRKFIELRAKFGLDDIHKECEKNGTAWRASAMPHADDMKKYWSTMFDEDSLRTQSGHLMWYDPMGDYRTKEMLTELPNEKILKYLHTMFERRTSTLDKISRKEGKIVKIIRVMDLEGSGFWQMNRQWTSFEKEYVNPVLMGTSIETVHVIFVNNFPKIFLNFWNIFKVIIPPRLLARFRLLGTEYIQDKEFLAEVGLKLNTELIKTNKSHKEGSSLTGDSWNYEGKDQQIPAGLVMERVLEVSPGQKVTWDFAMGKGDGGSSGGFFSKMATQFSGSEVMFSVDAIWTDKNPQDIPKVSAKVRSAGADNGDTAEFWVDGTKIEYTAGTGVNIVAVDLDTKAVLSSKAYDTSKDEANKDLVSDIAALPGTCAVLMAVKGTGAEELSNDAWSALEGCGAVLKEGHWHKGYALIGTRWGQCISEVRSGEAVAEGEVPTLQMAAELVPPKEISIESGSQTGSVQLDRGGMVIVRWSNQHSYMANKALSQFKLAVEGGKSGGYS